MTVFSFFQELELIPIPFVLSSSNDLAQNGPVRNLNSFEYNSYYHVHMIMFNRFTDFLDSNRSMKIM